MAGWQVAMDFVSDLEGTALDRHRGENSGNTEYDTK